VSAPAIIWHGIAVEGACDFFFGRPFDENPYARSWDEAWHSWRAGWLDAAWFDEARGDEERARWRLEDAA
jgi:hypothetical protein